ncbi:MAG: hypothetical protein WKI04_15775, partial [Ferruginibacter sp.]
MMTEITDIHQPDSGRVFEEFSPKKLVLQMREAGTYALSKWLIILLIATVAGSIAAIITALKKTTYTAEITFALDEGAAQSAKSDFAQISEQLGIGTVMDAGGVFSSVTNILEL